MDKETFEPKPAFQKLRIENTAHGIHFSPDSHYLAFTTIDGPGTIEVYNVKDMPIQRVCLLPVNYTYLRPKDVCFTKDAKYVAIIYSMPISIKYIKRIVDGPRLAIHRFDAKTGMIEEKSLVAFDNNNSLFGSFELAAFRPDINPKEYRLFITNQAQDKVVEVAFNPDQFSLQVSGSHRLNLSFPHGIDVSGDGKLIAVTNFGDDSIRIFELENESDIPKNTRTHILLCGHSVSPHLFGAERSLIDLAVAFNHHGYKVSCLLPHENSEYTDELARYVNAVFHLSFDWSNHARPFDEHHVALIADLIQRESIDIVHSNSIVIPDAHNAARRMGIPCVLHARELILDDVEIAVRMGDEGEQILQNLTRDFDYIIANSFTTMNQFPIHKNIFCLYNAIDVNRFNLPVISYEGALKVGMISNNTQRKGLQDFIELSKTAITEPLLEFYLIGPKNQEVERIESELRNYRTPPKIYFIDYVPDPVKAMTIIDVVVSLSTVSESFGRTIAEGMAARRPVIVYNRCAMPELVKHQETGFLIPNGDVTGVLECLRWLETNRDKARIMGDAGRHFVETTFSFELFQKNP